MRFLLWFLCVLFFVHDVTAEEAGAKESYITKGVDKLSSHKASVTAESEPSSFVGNVNTIFGNLLLPSVDLTVQSPVPLPVIRYYNSQSTRCLWMYGMGMSSNYPLGIQGGELDDEGHYAYMIAEEDGGSIVSCAARVHHDEMTFYLEPATIHEGLTNAGGNEIGARTNLKNLHYKLKMKGGYHGQREVGSWTAYLPNGGEREYHTAPEFDVAVNLRREKKPNGNSVEYSYHGGNWIGGQPKEIRAVGDKETLSWLKIDYDKKKNHIDVTASNGKTLCYSYSMVKTEKFGLVPFIKKVTSTDIPDTSYEYDEVGHQEYLSKVSFPDGRFVKYKYDKQGRVIEQRAPIGKDNAVQTLFRYEYKDYHTNVWDARNVKSTFWFSSKKRLTRVEKELNGEMYRGEQLIWGSYDHISKGSRDESTEGNLLAKTVYGSDKKSHSCLQYTYDSHGNVIQETLFGNLTGNGKKSFDVSKDGEPEDKKLERYSKYYTYSKDRFHRLTEATEDDGSRVVFRYKPKTDLLSAKYTYDGKKIRVREFFEYDENAVVVKKIIDNGSSEERSDLTGVTERRITDITPVRKKTAYGVGQPESIIEMYYDVAAKETRWLNCHVFSYNQAGLVTREQVFDAHHHKKYTLYNSYNKKNKLIEHVDAIKRKTTYRYDENLNKTREQLVGSGVCTTFEYDHADRVIAVHEHFSDNSSFDTTFAYDAAGNKTAMTDKFGERTWYEYDDVNRLTKIVYPYTVSTNETTIRPTITKRYDLFDNVSEETDQNGHKTCFEYTIRNTPSLITYPDGTTEQFEYNVNGTLAWKKEKNGTKTIYTYDFLKRVVKTEKLDAEGKSLSTTSNEYDAFHCISSTDPMGYTTVYQYDGAGRLSNIIRATKKKKERTEYLYDTLGRRRVTRQYLDDKTYLTTIEERDCIDRVTEVKTEAPSGKLLSWKKFTYDIRGNCTEYDSYSSMKSYSATKTSYDVKNQPSSITDALSHTTKTTYNYAFDNGRQQKVLQKTTTDPLGMRTIETMDAFGRLESIEKFSPKKALLSRTIFRYDGKGNKTSETQELYSNGVRTGTYRIEWAYNAVDQVITMVEQPRTAEEKRTSYTYNKAGLLKNIYQPNEVSLYHTYDGLSRLSTLEASDKSIFYEYTYDRNNNPITIKDKVSGHVLEKTYDVWGRERSEMLFPDLAIRYSHDALGRVTKYQCFDHVVEYRYNDGTLSDVIRKDNNGKEHYRHHYSSFDMEGNVTKAELINNLGAALFSWDALGRNTSIKTPYWNEALKRFDAVGNLLEASFTDGAGTAECAYSYDDLYQLKHESGVITASYQNDSIANRLKKNDNVYTINTLNQLLSNGEGSFSYDKNGNVTQIVTPQRTLRFSYDGLNRLTAIEEPKKFQVKFLYDAFHRRIRKDVFTWKGSWKKRDRYRYVYFGQREIGALDSSNNVVEFRTLGVGKGAELGAAIAIELHDTLFCPIHDHRGNVTALINAKKQVAESYRYSAFGEEKIFDQSGNSISESSLHNPWRFASKRVDSETGLSFFGRRYYLASTGRFITADPVGFGDGPNLYAYTHNSPLMLVDPYGLTAMEDESIIGSEFAEGFIEAEKHPFNTFASDAMYLLEIPKAINSFDFSHISEVLRGSSRDEMVQFAARRSGEVTSIALLACPLGEIRKLVISTLFRSAKVVASWAARRAATRAATKAAEATVEKTAAVYAEQVGKRSKFFQNARIHPGKQGKHISGTNSYKTLSEEERATKSLLTTNENPTDLLREAAGNGTWTTSGAPWEVGGKEVFDFRRPIGIWKGKEGTISLPSTRGTVHYKANAEAHIVPAHPQELHTHVFNQMVPP
jgi:RHS repeat-associated protein